MMASIRAIEDVEVAIHGVSEEVFKVFSMLAKDKAKDGKWVSFFIDKVEISLFRKEEV